MIQAYLPNKAILFILACIVLVNSSCKKANIPFVDSYQQLNCMLNLRLKTAALKHTYVGLSTDLVLHFNADNTVDGKFGYTTLTKLPVSKNTNSKTRNGSLYFIKCGTTTFKDENGSARTVETEIWIKGTSDVSSLNCEIIQRDHIAAISMAALTLIKL